jgi:hypothetical protein
MIKPTQLTSVKVDTELFNSFKMLILSTKCDFRTLVNQSLKMYIEQEEFRKKVHEGRL